MSRYIGLTCAGCRRVLNVRRAYLGRWVTCNHCEHSFVAYEIESVESLESELQSTRNENARLSTTVQVLKSELLERVSEAERLKRSAEDLNTLRAERDRLEAERRALSVL